MGMFISLKDINVNAKKTSSISDTVLSSGNQLNIDTGEIGNLCLELNSKYEWLNNPHPEVCKKEFDHEPGTVTQVFKI